MIDYVALKAADAALNPPVPDPVQAAAVLSAQMQASPIYIDLPVDVVRQILAFSGTGDFKKAEDRASSTLNGGAGDPGTVASHALMVAAKYSSHFPTSNATARASIITMMNNLQTAGILSAATVNALTAAWTKQVPVWPRTITGPDVTSARTLY